MLKNNRGITLIALVVSVIVLLILAGVSINMLTGQNGILKRTNEAKMDTAMAQKEEEKNIEKMTDIITDYTNIDWNYAKQNTKKHPDQKESQAIAIGTNGKTVNMDLWEYNYDDVTGGYGLNDSVSLQTTASANASSGYQGKDWDNIVIPQYIKADSTSEWIAVTNLDWTFYNCEELKSVNKIPETVKSMRYTFRETKISEVPELPSNLENMLATFYNCKNIKETGKIPDSVTNMNGTFCGCNNLNKIINIPQNVIDMQLTFYMCESLEEVNLVIPYSVEKFYNAFRDCSNLSGEITMKANLTGKVLENNRMDYEYCFKDTATNSNGLVVRCKKDLYDVFYDKDNHKIKSLVSDSNSNIKLCIFSEDE